MSKVLAIDPGRDKSGWVLMIDGEPRMWGWDGNTEILGRLEVGGNFGTDVVIEDITSYGMPVGRDIFETVRWTGRFEQACDGPVTYIPRKDVLLELCGSARGNDSTLRQAIIDHYGGDSVAIGGKKCKTCSGKGWRGRGHEECVDCKGKRVETPAGVLHGISGHVWSSVGVGLTYIATVNKNVSNNNAV